MGTVRASQLRLHPQPDGPRWPAPVRRVKRRALLLAVLSGVFVAGAVKLVFTALRYVRAEGDISISAVPDDQCASVMTRHLGRIQLCSISLPDMQPGQTLPVNRLIERGALCVYASDDRTITLVSEDRSKHRAAQIVRAVQTGYLGQFRRTKEQQIAQATEQQKRQADNYSALRQDAEKLKAKLAELNSRNPSPQGLDQSIIQLGKKIETSLAVVQQRAKTLAQLQDQMIQTERQLRHPTVRVDPQRLRQACLADRLFAYDHQALSAKHDLFLKTVNDEMDSAEASLTALKRNLRGLAQSVLKQLLHQLPSDLSDDLHELNMTAELYDGQIGDYQQRWTTCREKVLELLATPEQADYNGIQTLLSQTRRDAAQLCGELPKHLQGLFDRLKSPPQADARRPGQLSAATVRSIACAAVEYDLQQALLNWQRLNQHLDRLLGEGHPKLQTVGYFCRRLQRRVLTRQKQIAQRIEQQSILVAKRRAREKLLQLQSQFQQSGAELTDLWDVMLTDQRTLCRITASWPQWQKLSQQAVELRAKLTEASKHLATGKDQLWLEELRAGGVLVDRLSRAGVIGEVETPVAMMIGILFGAVVYFPLRIRDCLAMNAGSSSGNGPKVEPTLLDW